MKLQLLVNGEKTSVEVSPWKRLLDVLREDLHLTGSKEGCGEGECGACTVLINGEPACSCLVAVGQVQGVNVETVEGLARGEKLSVIQNCLVEFGGAQCGICTPGIAVSATYCSRQNKNFSRDEWREKMAGNICRCTGYQLIVDALMDAQAKAES